MIHDSVRIVRYTLPNKIHTPDTYRTECQYGTIKAQYDWWRSPRRSTEPKLGPAASMETKHASRLVPFMYRKSMGKDEMMRC